MSRFAPSDGPLPTSLSQGVNDGEIHREIHTADLFDDPAATAPAEGFSKPSPLKAASPSDLDASSLPDKATRLTDEAPGGELGVAWRRRELRDVPIVQEGVECGAVLG
ncbi:MAG: hypothetical protein ALECFALPRED_011156 [Alectoria fallacina]|uniref:Uncharacterized protein n=1 Tax=Alectoria fallacina TaxID=1903189 RepID=A0A8H3PL50_9LECA|nr:MAG: hypothetical protein ALECFALPRED_011156 [Alectoria fallacina]